MDVPTKRTVLRRKELKLQPPALMLLSDLGHVFSLDCIQYMRPSPIIIYRWRRKIRLKVRWKHTHTQTNIFVYCAHLWQSTHSKALSEIKKIHKEAKIEKV